MIKKALVVEGIDDMYSVINLTEQHGFTWRPAKPYDIEVVDGKGYPKLLKTVPVVAKTFERVGILLDADTDPAARWTSVRDSLLKLDVELPEDPSMAGTLVTGFGGRGRLGVWMMPDNGAAGYLENFLAALVPQGAEPLWNHAKASTAEAISTHACGVKSLGVAKAEIHTYLAWQAEPGLPFGTALKARYFDVNVEAAKTFVAWFTSVFAD